MSSLFSSFKNSRIHSLLSPIYQNQTLQKSLFLTGLALVSWKVLRTACGALSYLFTRETDLIARYGKGSYVLITGGSDGIGKEFAVQFAQRGFNLVLVARNQGKLEDVRREITGKYPGVDVRIVVADFTQVHQEGFCERIYEEVKDLDISILFNNVGLVEIEYYHNIPIKAVRELVIVNCLSQALMTRVFLPKLVERGNAGKVRSAIIDNASLAAEYPRPYLQVYAATKVFSNYLSIGLSYEHPTLDVLSYKPGVVDTKLAAGTKMDSKTCTTEQSVTACLRYLGKTTQTNGHWKHQFLSWFLGALPEPSLKKRLQKNLYIALEQIRAEKNRQAALKDGSIQASKL